MAAATPLAGPSGATSIALATVVATARTVASTSISTGLAPLSQLVVAPARPSEAVTDDRATAVAAGQQTAAHQATEGVSTASAQDLPQVATDPTPPQKADAQATVVAAAHSPGVFACLRATSAISTPPASNSSVATDAPASVPPQAATNSRVVVDVAAVRPSFLPSQHANDASTVLAPPMATDVPVSAPQEALAATAHTADAFILPATATHLPSDPTPEATDTEASVPLQPATDSPGSAAVRDGLLASQLATMSHSTLPISSQALVVASVSPPDTVADAPATVVAAPQRPGVTTTGTEVQMRADVTMSAPQETTTGSPAAAVATQLDLHRGVLLSSQDGTADEPVQITAGRREATVLARQRATTHAADAGLRAVLTSELAPRITPRQAASALSKPAAPESPPCPPGATASVPIAGCPSEAAAASQQVWPTMQLAAVSTAPPASTSASVVDATHQVPAGDMCQNVKSACCATSSQPSAIGVLVAEAPAATSVGDGVLLRSADAMQGACLWLCFIPSPVWARAICACGGTVFVV